MPQKRLITSPGKMHLTILVLGLFLAAIFSLLLTPTVVHLSESQILAASNEAQPLPQYLQPEITKAQEVKPQPIITVVAGDIPAPKFHSGAVMAEDLLTGKILFEKNIHSQLAPASTTKIMTALVAEEHFRAADELIVPAEAMVGGSSMGLNVGERMTFRSVLYGMMLNSGNDAAFTIALNYPGGLSAFVAKMNQKVKDLGLSDTHFDNPAGFDSQNHYSSAYDLSVIAKEAIKKPTIAKIVSTKETSVLSLDKGKEHDLKNLNKLLLEKGFIGIKTGFTEKAGENFVGLVDRDGKRVITVVLSSDDRFGETVTLIDWVFANFRWVES